MKVIAVLLLFAIHCHAQSNERIQRTWKGPDVSVIWDLLKEEEKGGSPENTRTH